MELQDLETRYREFPVFVPCDGESLAAVVTAPVDEPRGLVLLLSGLGASRSHRFSVWTRTARRLAAESGLASLRLDYLGLGDSSGYGREWGDETFSQVLPALEFAREATGFSEFAVAGYCLGAHHALHLAADLGSDCAAAVCIRPYLLRENADAGSAPAARRLHRVVRLLRGKLAGIPIGAAVERFIPAAAGSTRLLFLYDERSSARDEAERRALERMLRALPDPDRRRAEFRVLPGLTLRGFRSLPAQDLAIDQVCEWLRARYSEHAGARASASGLLQGVSPGAR